MDRVFAGQGSRSLFLVGGLVAVSTGAVLASCATAPAFLPAPAKVYAAYSAIDEPRENVPVGALWIQGYGPYGEGAEADNLITIRSLGGYAVNSDVQIALTLGLGSLLNLDPTYRKHVTAKFSDVSIVRVKHVSKLAGPPNEPRIYEALRAGTITITAEKAFGTDLGESARSQGLVVLRRGDSGQTKSITIDGKDLFIAFRVVTLEPAHSKVEKSPIRLRDDKPESVVHGYRISFNPAELGRCMCNAPSAAAAAVCKRDNAVPIVVSRADTSSSDEVPVASFNLDRDQGRHLSIPLPVPVSNGRQSLLTSLVGSVTLDLESTVSTGDAGQCTMKIKGQSSLALALSGSRLRTLRGPIAPTW